MFISRGNAPGRGRAARPEIQARARDETEAVYGEDCSDCLSLEEERRRLRDSTQCAFSRIHLAMEGMRVQIAHSKELLGLN